MAQEVTAHSDSPRLGPVLDRENGLNGAASPTVTADAGCERNLGILAGKQDAYGPRDGRDTTRDTNRLG